MEVLVLDGKNYVKASKAAKDLGYATDYVGQLCRSGQVDAHLIGRTWYVNQEQLGAHRIEKKRISRVKARAQAKKAIEERRIKVTETKNNYANIDIRYEDDSKELIPETKKLEVRSESAAARAIANAEIEESGGNIIDNPGEKILFKGDLTVVDVTDGPSDDDTVTLTPRMIRKKPQKQTSTTQKVEKNTVQKEIKIKGEKGDEDEDVAINLTDRPIPTFEERLAMKAEQEPSRDAGEPASGIVTEEEVAFVSDEHNLQGTEASSILPYVAVVIVMFMFVVLTLPLSLELIYTESSASTPVINFLYSIDDLINIIQLKIK